MENPVFEVGDVDGVKPQDTELSREASKHSIGK